MSMRVALALGGTLLAGTATVALAAEKGGTDAAALHLVPLDEITVPIVDQDRVDGALSVKLVLQASDADGERHLTAISPQLRAASVAAVLEFSRLYASPLKPVDAGQLSRDLATALQQQDGTVERVLLVEVAARPA